MLFRSLIIAPTCTQKGYTLYTCNCEESYKDNETEALGHNFTEYINNNDATCVKDATETAKCDRCDEIDTKIKEGSLLGHSFTNYIYQNDATCIEDGTEKAKCDFCDESSVRKKEGTALGHDYLINDYDFDTERINRFCKRAGCEYKDFFHTDLQTYCNSLTNEDVGTTCTLSIDGIQYHVILIGVNHDSAHTTWQLLELYDTQYMINSNGTNIGGWGASDMRNKTMSSLYNKLTLNVRNKIKSVPKTYLKVNRVYSNPNLDILLSGGYVSYSTSYDKLFLLSRYEYEGKSSVKDGNVYEYYSKTKNYIKYTLSGKSASFWTRTPGIGNAKWSCMHENMIQYTAREHYISFAFCI